MVTYIELLKVLGCILPEESFRHLKEFGFEQLLVEIEGQHYVN